MRARVWASSVLPQPVGPEQHDVRLLQLDLGVLGLGHLDALVVVVDGDREGALGGLLADHVLLQDVVDLARLRQVLQLDAPVGGVSSSSMISLQRSMHSSQM